ncbi:MAG: DUF3794 domain-containing protein [Clostridia bacterium]|nr:DUF3794 domain-containing protein [Clostridia bacterium]
MSNINCSYKDLAHSECFADKTEKTTCDCDMIVPDAQSDAAKVISADAHARISRCEYASGRVTISGSVTFNILYISDEENPRVCSVTKSAPFTHVSLCESSDENVVCIASAAVSSVSFSLVNGRRIKASCDLTLSISCFKNMRDNILTSLDGAECLKREITLTALKTAARKEISLNETLDLPAGKGAIGEILRSFVSVSNYEAKPLHNKLMLKGSLLASILYLSDGNLNTASVEIPFTEVVDAEGLAPGGSLKTDLSIADCEILPETDLSGEYKMINAAVVLSVLVLSTESETCEVVTDAYLPHGALKCECAKIRLNGAQCEPEEEFIKENLSLNSSNPPLSRVFDMSCRLSEPNCDENGMINGFVEVTILYLSSDPSNPLASFSGKIPYTHKSSCKSISSVKASLNHSSYTISSQNELEVRLSLLFTITPANCETINVFTSVEEDAFTPSDRPSITISFVSDCDTLWSVAKKHNISLSDLISANALSENQPLKKGEKLLIPR